MRRYGAWVAILLLTLYVVFVGGAWFGLYSSTIRLVSMALVAGTFVVWALVAWRSPAWRPRSVLLPVILLALGSLALSTVFSRYPRQSVEYLGYAIVLAALYLLLVRILADPFLRARVGVLTVALTAVLGSAFVVTTVSHWIDWWGLVGRLAVPPLRPESESLVYGNPSAVMTIVVLFWCSAAAVVGTESRRRILVTGALGGLAAYATFVSGSRSGWLAIGVAVLAFGMVWLAGADRRRAATDRLRSILDGTAGRLGIGALLVTAAGAAIVLAPAILRRLGEGGEDLRVNYLLAAGRMFAEAPLVGTGPGTWVVQRIRYTIAPETDYYIPHAHNVYAQTFAELGVVGAIVGLLLVIALVRLIRPALADSDHVRRRWGWAAAFALIYFAAHNLLDFYANMPAILVAAAIPVAWLDATAVRRSDRAMRPAPLPASLRTAGAVAGVVAVALATAGMIATELPASRHSDAVNAYNDGDWALADREARAAAAADPDWPPYRFTEGLAASAVGDHERAATAFRAVAEADDLPEAWLDLAAEEASLGNDATAREALERAARLGLQRPAVAMAIGELARRLGMSDLSTEAYIEAIVTIPSLAGDPWWQADPARAEGLPALVDAAIEAAGPAAKWEIALMAGDADRARSLAAALATGTGTGADPLDVIAAWAGDDAAFARIEAACRAHPSDPKLLAWAARLSRRNGDLADADAYVRWGYVSYSTAGDDGAEVRVSEPRLLGRSSTGRLADFWGTYTYRRPTPWITLVPSLVQLKLE